MARATELMAGSVERRRADHANFLLAVFFLFVLVGVAAISAMDADYASNAQLTSAIHHILGTHDPREAVPDSRKIILVLAQDDSRRLIAKTTLERYNCRVLLAASGQEAVDAFTRLGPRVALVVLDGSAVRSSIGPMVEKMHRIQPAVKVLGFGAGAERSGKNVQVSGWMTGPFSAVPLAEAAGKLLAAR